MNVQRSFSVLLSLLSLVLTVNSHSVDILQVSEVEETQEWIPKNIFVDVESERNDGNVTIIPFEHFKRVEDAATNRQLYEYTIFWKQRTRYPRFGYLMWYFKLANSVPRQFSLQCDFVRFNKNCSYTFIHTGNEEILFDGEICKRNNVILTSPETTTYIVYLTWLEGLFRKNYFSCTVSFELGPPPPTTEPPPTTQPPPTTPTVPVAETGCGAMLQDTDRIVGGVDSAINNFPWQANLRIPPGYFCGAVLIHESFVVTAAHCAVLATEPITVILGAHYLDNTVIPGKEVFSSIAIIIHEDYDGHVTNDIALIKLDRPASINSHINTICLPPAVGSGEIPIPEIWNENEKAKISGWGNTETGGNLSPILQEAEVKLQKDSVCGIYGSVYQPSIMGCAVENPNVGTCSGDSGGPLSYFWVDRYFLIGLTSFGAAESCSAYPSAFTEVASYVPWINSKIL